LQHLAISSVMTYFQCPVLSRTISSPIFGVYLPYVVRNWLQGYDMYMIIFNFRIKNTLVSTNILLYLQVESRTLFLRLHKLNINALLNLHCV
jgi:hypothetical protein